MTQSKIHAVLFDFGGVIAEEGFYNGLINLAEEQALDARSMPDEGTKAAYDSGFVLGQAKAPAFWALMRKRTGLEGEDDFLSDRIIDGFQLRHWVIELVRKLSAKAYITGILSDQTHWLNELDHYDHFFREFNYIFNSYDIGKGKRDPTLFTDVASSLQLQPDEVLFIDDQVGNVQRARDMGLIALLYTDHKTFISGLEDILKEKLE